MKHRFLIGFLGGGAVTLGIGLGLGVLLRAAREAIVSASQGSPPEAAFVAVVVGTCAVMLTFPLALALGGWLAAGAVWGAVRLSRLLATCLRPPRDGHIVRLRLAPQQAAGRRKAA